VNQEIPTNAKNQVEEQREDFMQIDWEEIEGGQ
jgi:hypothetical protein